MIVDIDLIVSHDKVGTFQLRTEQAVLTIGRSEENDIQLTERNVSRQHAILRLQENFAEIEDLQSFTGVYVNGGRIEGARKIVYGDVIRIGEYAIEMHSAEAQRLHEQTVDHRPLLQSIAPPMGGVLSETMELPSRANSELVTERTDQVKITENSQFDESLDMPRLIVISTVFAGTVFPLREGEYTIGRVDENDIVIEHRSVSRKHASVRIEDGHVWVQDLGGVNGIVVNEELFDSVEVHSGDLVELGRVILRYTKPGERFELSSEQIEMACLEDLEVSQKTGRSEEKAWKKWLGIKGGDS